MAKKSKVSQNVGNVIINTSIGEVELAGELAIGVQVLSKHKEKAFYCNGKIWLINKNNIIHACL